MNQEECVFFFTDSRIRKHLRALWYPTMALSWPDPLNLHSHKRLTQQKKQKERERKELDALGRRHLANVRVVQRNVVYVVGIGPRFAKEEVWPFSTIRHYLSSTFFLLPPFPSFFLPKSKKRLRLQHAQTTLP
jgi:hypothetical protein